MQRKAAIESEFDEPLRDVIHGFAQMSYSRNVVAEVLEVTPDSLKSYCRRMDIRFKHSPVEHQQIRGRPPRLIRHDGRVQSLSAWAYDLGVAPCTIHKRLRLRGRIA